MAYSLYSECMGHQLVTINKEKAGKSVTQFLTYPTGLSTLPCAGGLLDQPHRLMRLFSAFEDGEQLAFNDKLR